MCKSQPKIKTFATNKNVRRIRMEELRGITLFFFFIRTCNNNVLQVVVIVINKFILLFHKRTTDRRLDLYCNLKEKTMRKIV